MPKHLNNLKRQYYGGGNTAEYAFLEASTPAGVTGGGHFGWTGTAGWDDTKPIVWFDS